MEELASSGSGSKAVKQKENAVRCSYTLTMKTGEMKNASCYACNTSNNFLSKSLEMGYQSIHTDPGSEKINNEYKYISILVLGSEL